MIPGELEQTLRDDRTPLLAASIRANRDRIVEAWNTELRLSGRRPSTLGAHATELLDELARSLADLERDDTPRSRRNVAPAHERPCFDDGDDLHTVVFELGALRRAVEEMCGHDEHIPRAQLFALGRYFDRALESAATRCSRTGEFAARYRAIAESGIIGVVEWKVSGAITAANDTFLRMLGYTREDLRAGRLRFRELTPPEQQAATDENLRILREKGVLPPIEKQYFRKDGSRVDVLITSAVLDPEGQRGIALQLDITDRRRAAEELRREALLRDQFIGVLGHELRTPLGAVSTGCQLLLMQNGLAPAQHRVVARIANSADKMARMIGDLLDFTRGRFGGGIVVDRKPIDMADVCREAVEEVHVAHPKRELVFRSSADTTGEWDPDRVAQVTANLVANAIAHGDETALIEVEVRGEGGDVLLEVSNQGVIPPEVLPHAFEPFTRSPAARSAGTSLGLGLFIVKQIVDAHGGTIDVRSNEVEGTTFLVRWPRRA